MEAFPWILFVVTIIWSVIATRCAVNNRTMIEQQDRHLNELVEMARRETAKREFAEKEMKIVRSEAGIGVRAIQDDVSAAFRYLESARRSILERNR